MQYRFEIYSPENKETYEKLKLQTRGIIYVRTEKSLSDIEIVKLKNQYLKPYVNDQVLLNTTTNTEGFKSVVEVNFKPGVTDNTARAAESSLRLILNQENIAVRSAKIVLFEDDLSRQETESICIKNFANPLLHDLQAFQIQDYIEHTKKDFVFPEVKKLPNPVSYFSIKENIEKWSQWSKERLWALNKNELGEIINHFNSTKTKELRRKKSLPETPSDVEMEILAQTWSEHCKHKIFSAKIKYSEEKDHNYMPLEIKELDSIFNSFIRKPTLALQNTIKKESLVSLFSDNAGIIRFDENIDICAKVETHNSPSALDPYGGALTGILGVNRDIMGTGIGAEPIANLDVFCFAPMDLPKRHKLPPRLLPPSQVLKGVHKGVEDGGNKSGIPTVNGSMLFDDNYAGKPLVYVGTIGYLPSNLPHYKDSSQKNHKKGDCIYIAGGRVGADGIHGATFSSLALDETPPATAVQIGDPFTQKKLLDFQLKARDAGLYNSVTDNGAGGISSSVGEMAEKTGGATIYLDRMPTKYPGLSSFEKMISESQERMTFSVEKNKAQDFERLAKKMDVEYCQLGEFSDEGHLEVYDEGKLVAYLSMDFLHNGLPQLQLEACFEPSKNKFIPWHKKDFRKTPAKSMEEKWIQLLALPNISSKEDLVRNYDQEVKASTALKPFIGKTQSGPSDAAIIDLALYGGEDNNALGIANGNQSLYAKQDAYFMAIASCDEAVRNLVSTGVAPHTIALLDNFCWPDPIESESNPDGKHKLAQLVRAGHAIKDFIEHTNIPFISGKDSMKNDFVGKDFDGKDIKISVPPSLLVTGIGQANLNFIMDSSFKKPGDLVYLIGPSSSDCFTISEWTRNFKTDEEAVLPEIHWENMLNRYSKVHQLVTEKIIHSCHDISEGGIAVALAESCFGNNLGFSASKELETTDKFWFNENLCQFIVSLPEENKNKFENIFKNDCKCLGVTNSEGFIAFGDQKLSLESLFKSWRNFQ